MAKSKYAAKKDSNHTAIARILTDVGAQVFDVSRLPGALDMVVGFRGVLYWLEVKQPSSRKDLTELEQATIARLQLVGAPVYVVCSADEALAAIGVI